MKEIFSKIWLNVFSDFLNVLLKIVHSSVTSAGWLHIEDERETVFSAVECGLCGLCATIVANTRRSSFYIVFLSKCMQVSVPYKTHTLPLTNQILKQKKYK